MAEIEATGLINEAVGEKTTVVCAAGNMPGELLRLWRPDEPKAYHLEYGFSCILQTDKPSPQRIPVPDYLATNQYYFGAAGESLVRRHPDTARIVTRSGTALLRLLAWQLPIKEVEH